MRMNGLIPFHEGELLGETLFGFAPKNLFESNTRTTLFQSETWWWCAATEWNHQLFYKLQWRDQHAIERSSVVAINHPQRKDQMEKMESRHGGAIQ